MAIFNAQLNTGDRALNINIPDDILQKYQSQVSSGQITAEKATQAIIAESSERLNPTLYKTEAETPIGGYFGPGGPNSGLSVTGTPVYQKTENGVVEVGPNLRGALNSGQLTNYYSSSEIDNFNQFSSLLLGDKSPLLQQLKQAQATPASSGPTPTTNPTTPVSTSTPASTNTPVPTSNSATPVNTGTTPPTSSAPNQQTQQTNQPTNQITPQAQANTQALTQLVSQYNLSPDQQKALESIYNAVVQNDQTKVDQLVKGMAAAKEFSDPYFKAQLTLATDALQRGIQSKDTDLNFKEQQLNSALKNLQQDVSAGKSYLSFQQKQELNNLQRQYEDQLSSTQDSLAATGFTQSSRRSKQEQILNDVNSGLVQSTNRAYGEKQTGLSNQQARAEQDTAAQIQYYKDITSQGKLDLLRQAESQIGTANLGALGQQTLGGSSGVNIGGAIPQKQVEDQLSFANSFVF